MPPKEELANELKVAQLRKLAEDNDVDLEGATTKQEIAEKITSSRKVTKQEIEDVLGEDDSTAQSDEVSPTGSENVAGIPQSELQQAPPMVDQSGSNIPAPNLVQPLAEGARVPGGGASDEGLDPMLTDPDRIARERVEGRTSDAARRSSDARAANTNADLNDGPKQSDAGPEQYPFPPAGDVDVATVKTGEGGGEYLAPVQLEDWVVLDGDHPLVPDRLDGRRAVVVDAPRHLIALADRDKTYITVRTRDDVNATLHIPLSAVSEIQRGGITPTVRG